MKLIRRYPELFILTGLALLTRLWDLFNPAAVVFDEVYFKVFAGDYFTHSYYFDIHPPLGKLLLAGWAWLARIDPSTLVNTSDPSVMLRVLPALAGAAIIPVFYVFLRQLKASRRIATLGAALLLLDNAILVESRFVLIDSMLILFGLSAVTCFLAFRQRTSRSRYWWLLAAAVLAGMAASTKWTGLAALGFIGIVWLCDQIWQWGKVRRRRRIGELAIISIIPMLVYMSVFAIHFSLLTKTGQGDAFMPTRFQATLIGNPSYDPNLHVSFLEKLSELNR